MEKLRLFVVLIFVTAIPIVISKNAKNGAINSLAQGMIAETNNQLRVGVYESFRKSIKNLSFLTNKIKKDEFDRFRKHFHEYTSVGIVNEKYETELLSGKELGLGSHEWEFIKKTITLGRPHIFLTVSHDSRALVNIVYPYKDKSDKIKCIYAKGDFSEILAVHTKPVTRPMAIYRYVYDSTNQVILPAFSNMSLGILLIKFLIRDLGWGKVGESYYWIYRKKIDMSDEKISIEGLHAVSVIPKSFMNHIMIEYRIRTNAILVIIFIVLAVMFIDIYTGYSKMEVKLAMYRGIIEDAGVAIVLFNIKNMQVYDSNRMARNLFYIEPGSDLKYFISKDADREYVDKILHTTGTLYNYKLGIRAKYNEEITVILSLGVNREREEATITFFEEDAVINKHNIIAELARGGGSAQDEEEKSEGIIAGLSSMFFKKSKKAEDAEEPSNEKEENEEGHTSPKNVSDEADDVKQIFINADLVKSNTNLAKDKTENQTGNDGEEKDAGEIKENPDGEDIKLKKKTGWEGIEDELFK